LVAGVLKCVCANNWDMALVLILGAQKRAAAAAYMVLRGHFARDIMRLPGLHNCIARAAHYTHTRARSPAYIHKQVSRRFGTTFPTRKCVLALLALSFSRSRLSELRVAAARFAARIVLISRAEFLPQRAWCVEKRGALLR
jgi:hypothetical protein